MSSLVRSIKRFFNDDMAGFAAALSYQLLISIFPFVIFLLAVPGLLNITELFDWLLEQAQTVLPGRASELVTNMMLIGPRLAAWVAKLVGLGDVFTSVWKWARIPVGVVLLVLIAALIYYLLPNTDQPFRLITPGALIAVIVWVVATLAFSWYVANFANYNAVYGSLAGVIVLLLYFFISAAILLLGAELNSELYHQTIEEEGPEEGAAKDGMEA